MSKLLRLFLCLPLICSASQGTALSLGSMPIGSAPNPKEFKSTSCPAENKSYDFSDCEAQDYLGRRYVFFDGVTAVVSAKASEVQSGLKLPAGMRFGEPISQSVSKATKYLKVTFRCASSKAGVICVSAFKKIAPAKVAYSLELQSNSKNKLCSVTERTDF